MPDVSFAYLCLVVDNKTSLVDHKMTFDQKRHL